MFFCNLCDAIINILKHFSILNLPYIIVKKIEYNQTPNDDDHRPTHTHTHAVSP